MKYLENIFTDWFTDWSVNVKYDNDNNSLYLDVNTDNMNIGDVFCIYGNDLIYGVVIDKLIGYNTTIYRCVYLTPSLILSGNSLKLRINHLVKSVKVSPIVFYITPDTIKYCDVVTTVDIDTVDKISQVYNVKANRTYRGVWKKFWDYESKKLEFFYDKFLEYLNTLD